MATFYEFKDKSDLLAHLEGMAARTLMIADKTRGKTEANLMKARAHNTMAIADLLKNSNVDVVAMPEEEPDLVVEVLDPELVRAASDPDTINLPGNTIHRQSPKFTLCLCGALVSADAAHGCTQPWMHTRWKEVNNK